jgi:hypothetical protein
MRFNPAGNSNADFIGIGGEPIMADNNADELEESRHEGKEAYDMDIDRMINEGLGGGQVTINNGLIEESTTDTMGVDPNP